MNDTLWQLEQLQTRARIRVSQSRFWLQKGMLVWWLGAVLAFMFGCYTAERKANVFIWLWSSYAPFITRVQWRGDFYDPAVLAGWLNEHVYDGTPLDWLLWSLALGSLPMLVGGVVGYWYVKRPEPGERHIRGTELLSREELQRRILKKETPGLQIAGVRIPEALHRNHVLICGATGSGKSVTIRQLLRQIAARGEAAIVVDPEGEFTREFYSPERGDYLLNPLDARCPEWSPWSECDSAAEREAQAASLFPVTPGMTDAAIYYHNLARLGYAKLLERLPQHDPRLIPKIAARTDDLMDLIGPQAKGMGTTLQIATRAFRHLQPSTRQWSAKDWVERQDGWVFLTFRETEKDAVLPLVSLWLESLTRRLLNRELAPEKTTWVVIDELAVLQAQPTLVSLMNRGRKRGVACVIGFQDVLQLHSVYGKEMASNLLDQPATRLLLRTNNGETQHWCSQDIGKREVVRPVESETAGPENTRDAISRSHQRREEPAVMASQFGALPNLSGYLKVAHYGAARVEAPYVGMVEHQPAFVERKAALSPTQGGAEQKVVSRKRRTL